MVVNIVVGIVVGRVVGKVVAIVVAIVVGGTVPLAVNIMNNFKPPLTGISCKKMFLELRSHVIIVIA